ncbi:Pyruvate dehydrogenase kinase 2 mitochondrial [Ceratocystis platani]|uniref:Protein-serine/threonine kinase n=1 Tax=Ceratocystis fimbriata f. sp. platani TaxID=88771 RepID=A0A0F8B408_CERFI|nr:Pyruvate dehydrogenase kinase 2 mitochondrial [Ceratocystis platani]
MVTWVAKEARPISLRQLMVFGKNLTEARLIDSANYLRTELPTRLAHRIRDMQQLPYAVVSNKNISEVYNLYYSAFDEFRKFKTVVDCDENDELCRIIRQNLQAHLTVIPKLAMGILESDGLLDPQALDNFMNTILRSAVQDLVRSTYGPSVKIPEIRVAGHLTTSFPYILSHIEYIVGELLRNSMQAVVEQQLHHPELVQDPLPAIEVTICSSAQHVILRISDRGGGIPRDELPYLWSFSKGPKSKARLEALQRVPLMAATLAELQTGESRRLRDEIGRADLRAPSFATSTDPVAVSMPANSSSGSLTSLSSRPPDLRLGMGLPLSRVYAEYWAGSLDVHSLEGYGTDAFLHVPKLGNKNEQLATRATMDAV